jgi:hypothetical protein
MRISKFEFRIFGLDLESQSKIKSLWHTKKVKAV